MTVVLSNMFREERVRHLLQDSEWDDGGVCHDVWGREC